MQMRQIVLYMHNGMYSIFFGATVSRGLGTSDKFE